MALPPNIRVNARVPFPSLVLSSGPITIAKASGQFTIGFTITAFGTVVPPPSDYAVTYVLAYNTNTNQFEKVSLSALTITNQQIQRSVTATPIVVGANDMILNCNINTAAACTLPAASTRLGMPLTFKDLGQAAANNITLTPAGVETIDGRTNLVMNANHQSVTLVPFNDGVNTGWAIE